jgi:lipopolysaccharide transport system permease protein
MVQELILRPVRGISALNVSDLWRNHELLWALTWRQISIRYKQTAIGVAWVVLQPVIMTMLFTFVFARMMKFSAGDIPYPVFVMGGLVAWQFIARAVGEATNSLVSEKDLLTKVYFPRLILPVSYMGAAAFDMLIGYAVVACVMLFYGVGFGLHLLAFPVFLLLIMALAAGLGVAFAALNALYRDFGYVVPLFVQVWMFASPVIYPASLIPPEYTWLYVLNPLVGLLEGLRWSLLGGSLDVALVGASALFAVLMALVGIFVFKQAERSVTDKV